MSKFFKVITGVLIANIIALGSALVFITAKKLEPKPQAETPNDQKITITLDPKINYKVTQWKLIGQLENSDLAYDFRNGLGGDLGEVPGSHLLDGESIWLYSEKLREILTEANKEGKLYRVGSEQLKGYVAVINRVSKTKIDNPALWKIFPTTIGDHRFNIVSPSKIDLLKNDEANKIFYEARKEIDVFFETLQADPTAKK